MRLGLLLLFLFTLQGCVTTEFYSQLNSERDAVMYQRILIKFVDLRPGMAPYGEQTLQAAISQTFGPQIQCYLSTEEFYSGLVASSSMKADIQAFERDKNIDAVLICLSVSGEGLKENQYPNTGGYGTNTIMTDQKANNCRLELVDLRTQKSVWYSTGHVDANGILYSFKDLMKIFIQKSVKDLKIKKLLGPNNLPPVEPEKPADKPKQEI